MHSRPYNLPRFSAALICCVWSLCATATSAQDLNLPRLPQVATPSDTFTLSKPIAITDTNKNTQLLVGMENGQLRLSFPNMPGAEAIVPIDGDEFIISAQVPAGYNRLLNEYQLGNLGTFITGLQETAEPLAGFLMIPPENTNFHSIFIRYYEAIVTAGRLEDAAKLTNRMPWGQLPQEYIALSERLVYRSIEDREFQQTQKLLSLLFQSLTEESFAGIAFRVADTLRAEGNHELAAMVYGSLALSEDSILRQKSLLWAGYSRAVSKDADGARNILNQVQVLERSDENFLTYCLALGRLGYAEDNISDGLRHLSRAMVLTAVDATFKPELYYLLSVGYWESGNRIAADRLAKEFSIFYPENPWLKKYQADYANTL
ncbi:MAG TPA: hypothetical protein DCX06_09050 [Opitutae bacterium]|nr:hypothetical protein [Opitutae bacterium]